MIKLTMRMKESFDFLTILSSYHNIDCDISGVMKLLDIKYSDQALQTIEKLGDDSKYGDEIYTFFKTYPPGMNHYINYYNHLRKHLTINECLLNQREWIIVDLTLLTTTITDFIFKENIEPIETVQGHGNIILINTRTQEIERFEPTGNADILINNIDVTIKDVLIKQAPQLINYRYYTPLDYCPIYGPQYRSAYSQIYIDELNMFSGGWCGWWVLYYYIVRVLHPEISRNDILQLLNNRTPDELYLTIKEFRNQLINGTVPSFNNNLNINVLSS